MDLPSVSLLNGWIFPSSFSYFCTMKLVDTHTHLYTEEFDPDRGTVIHKALKNQVERMLLPNIDSTSVEAMWSLVKVFPRHCFPMMGLHPTSVNDQYEKELERVSEELSRNHYAGVGEIGMDLYWDQSFRSQQEDAFRRQLRLAKQYRLPVSIHTREAFDITYQIVKEELTDDLKGVFHCFTGTLEEAGKILDAGFKMGIGGVLTFKNSNLDSVVRELPLEALVLETDAPYLAPVPFRGKRNESSYIRYVAEKLAEVRGITLEEVAEVTTQTAENLFFT